MFRDELNAVCCSRCSRTCGGRVGRVVQLMLCPGILYRLTCSVGRVVQLMLCPGILYRVTCSVGRVVQLMLCPGILYRVTCSVSPAWVFVM